MTRALLYALAALAIYGCMDSAAATDLVLDTVDAVRHWLRYM